MPCVTLTVVRRTLSCSRQHSLPSAARLSGSSAPQGTSISRMFGRAARERDADPRVLAPGELGRLPCQVRTWPGHERDELLDARTNGLLHPADAPPQVVRRGRAHRLAADQPLAGLGLEPAIEGFQQRGLAGACGADHGEKGAGGHLGHHSPDDVGRTPVEGLRDALQGNHEGTRNTCASAPRPTRT
jgi:hypothetical protein